MARRAKVPVTVDVPGSENTESFESDPQVRAQEPVVPFESPLEATPVSMSLQFKREDIAETRDLCTELKVLMPLLHRTSSTVSVTIDWRDENGAHKTSVVAHPKLMITLLYIASRLAWARDQLGNRHVVVRATGYPDEITISDFARILGAAYSTANLKVLTGKIQARRVGRTLMVRTEDALEYASKIGRVARVSDVPFIQEQTYSRGRPVGGSYRTDATEEP